MEETKTMPPTPQRAAGTPIEGQDVREDRNAVSVNLEAYIPLLEDSEIPDCEKMELLRALYAIMASFVDLGFAVQVSPCGKLEESEDQSATTLRDHVYSSHSKFIKRFENAAQADADAAGEGV